MVGTIATQGTPWNDLRPVGIKKNTFFQQKKRSAFRPCWVDQRVSHKAFWGHGGGPVELLFPFAKKSVANAQLLISEETSTFAEKNSRLGE